MTNEESETTDLRRAAVGDGEALGRLLEGYRRKTPHRVLPRDRKSRSASLGLPELHVTAR